MGLSDRISIFFFQAEDGIRILVRSRGLGDVFKRKVAAIAPQYPETNFVPVDLCWVCLLYPFDVADDRPCVGSGVFLTLKKKTQ